mmetsp:Transcript_5856/g.9066  ORF Transcript_5856/g.9066 Transcript_5856/m.9066 type:complete len:129 (+) Transcript_5856:626-1012(+)
MSKQQLINAMIAWSAKEGAKHQLPKAFVSKFTAAVLTNMEDILLEKGRFTYPGFGTFTVRLTPERKRWNFATKEHMLVGAKNVVRFKASPSLLELAQDVDTTADSRIDQDQIQQDSTPSTTQNSGSLW